MFVYWRQELRQMNPSNIEFVSGLIYVDYELL